MPGVIFYAPLLRQLGAEGIPERSDEFVPIDTEAVGEEDKAKARRWSEEFQLDAIFSTDGDGIVRWLLMWRMATGCAAIFWGCSVPMRWDCHQDPIH